MIVPDDGNIRVIKIPASVGAKLEPGKTYHLDLKTGEVTDAAGNRIVGDPESSAPEPEPEGSWRTRPAML